MASCPSGLFGYNGVLSGIAVSVFHFGSDDDWQQLKAVPMAVVIASCLSTYVMAGLGGTCNTLFLA